MRLFREEKTPKDRIILWHGIPVKAPELVRVVWLLFENEERIYPRAQGYEGGSRFRRFARRCKGLNLEQCQDLYNREFRGSGKKA